MLTGLINKSRKKPATAHLITIILGLTGFFFIQLYHHQNLINVFIKIGNKYFQMVFHFREHWCRIPKFVTFNVDYKLISTLNEVILI